MLAHTCDPSSWKVEVGGLEVQGHPWLHSSKSAWAIGNPVSNKQKRNAEDGKGGGEGRRRREKKKGISLKPAKS